VIALTRNGSRSGETGRRYEVGSFIFLLGGQICVAIILQAALVLAIVRMEKSLNVRSIAYPETAGLWIHVDSPEIDWLVPVFVSGTRRGLLNYCLLPMRFGGAVLHGC
jgi:hypothetical protein